MLNKKTLLFIALFIPCLAHGATVVKTWNFASSTEGLADAGNSVTMAFAADTSTGNPTNCIHFSGLGKNSTQIEYARNASTGETWETWGVPSGATVNSIQVTSWSEETDTSILGVVASSVSIRIIDSGGTSVTSGAGDPIASVAVGTTGDSSWQLPAAGSSRNVDAGKQASTTDVRLEIQQYGRSSGASAFFDQRYDTISLTITYTAGGGGGSTASRHRIITSQ